MKRLFATLMLVVFLFQLAGCASPTPAPTATPLPTNTPTPVPTATPEPTPTLEPTPNPVSAETIDEIDKMMAKMYQMKLFNGIVLVAKDGKVLLYQAYGLADRTSHISLKTDDIMPLIETGSVIPAMPSYGAGIIDSSLLWLAEQGKISLANPICQYLPTCPDIWLETPIEDVIYQVSGIPDPYAKLDWKDAEVVRESPDRDDQIIQLAQSLPLELETSYASISPTNLSIKVKIIETVTGKPAGEYIKETLLDPLGITSIGKEYQASDIKVAGYDQYGLPIGDNPMPETMTFPNFIVGTVNDLYLLFQEYLEPKILPESVTNQLWKTETLYISNYVRTINLLDMPYDTFFDLEPNIGTWNNGWINEGYSIYWLISPQDQIIVILAQNMRKSVNYETSSEYMMIKQIREKLLGK